MSDLAADRIAAGLTPREIVEHLDRYIVGQQAAKRAVAVAVRNRYRRRQVEGPLREEIHPKNILLIGPTGVGKTEIARRLSRLTNAPFLKIEASKYTEVGYVGRDVESMVRDLVEAAVAQQRRLQQEMHGDLAVQRAEERILDLLLPGSRKSSESGLQSFLSSLSAIATGGESITRDDDDDEKDDDPDRLRMTRERFRRLFREGKLDGQEVEAEFKIRQQSFMEIFSSAGVEEMGFNMQNMMGNLFPEKTQKKRVTVKEAYEAFRAEEADKLVDQEKLVRDAIHAAEHHGILFIDEIDKVCGPSSQTGPDVSREGVQRDILPIVEGTTVVTKYGPIRTDHILFIAAGAFHVSKPSDLIPELQGRFPIRVELNDLSADDFVRILKDPENSILKQYVALTATEGVVLEFTVDAVEEIARTAYHLNTRLENIGARRLHTVCEKILEDLLYRLPDTEITTVSVDALYVQAQLADILNDEDLSRYIL